MGEGYGVVKTDVFLEHLRERWLAFTLSVAMFVIGTISGAITITAVTFHQRQDLIRYINTYFDSIMVGTLEAPPWQSVLWANFQVVAMVWLCGLLVFGVPAILILLLMRGFIIGFSVGFLVEEFGLRGFFFALSSIIPHNLLAVPALVGLSALSISFSLAVIFGARSRAVLRKSGSPITRFALHTIPYVGLMVLASLVEVFVTPVFIRAAQALF